VIPEAVRKIVARLFVEAVRVPVEAVRVIIEAVIKVIKAVRAVRVLLEAVVNSKKESSLRLLSQLRPRIQSLVLYWSLCNCKGTRNETLCEPRNTFLRCVSAKPYQNV
jgi:hypothetical protein